ncbi:MAG: endonuclease MutS2, partial [Chloroflexota bacterium]|nr:endonuclease MutS2 [Chloroflexota bacterium]
LGGVLEPSDLLTLAATLSAARGMRRIILKLSDTGAELPLLTAMAHRIEDLPDLENRIRVTISDRGDVLDSASPALGRVRSALRTAHDRLLQLLRSILNSSTYGPAIQEPIITQRQGRYVVPVKADFRARLPGIVHDTSNSGQTLFVEPLAAVESGNRWRELQTREAEEVERVLLEISGAVAEVGPEIRRTIEAVARLDFSLAKARYANALRAVRPEVVRASRLPRSEPAIRLPEARHPLLRGRVVPISLELGGAYRVLVITGPNTGGKTVALKTVGLLSLMAQSGLHVPTDPGARLPVLDDVFADIGDEQSIEQSLSTFSSHISNIVGMLGEVGPDSLVVLDELGAGTDPEEGSALARAIIDYLLERRCLAVTTTHYSELKSYAHTTPGTRNASVEFDEESLSPTYRLMVGLPGRSNALSIAGRLGMPAEILESARERVRPESRELNDLLQQIQDERDAASEARAAVQTEQEEARKLADRARRALDEAAVVRANALDDGRRQAQEELEVFRREMATLRRTLERSPGEQGRAEVQAVQEQLREMTRRTSSRPRHIPKAPTREIAPGDTVLVSTLGSSGRVLSVGSGTAEVQLGSLKSRVPLADLQLQAPRKEQVPEPVGRSRYRLEPRSAPPLELDLRGQRAEDVREQLDKYVDDAYLSGMPMLRIIHGKGTGVLRQVVREFLSKHPLVDSIEGGGSAQGGEGVTVASLSSR